MEGTMVTRSISFRSRRLLVVGLAGALLAAAIALSATIVLGTRSASGAGGGGGCFTATSVPVCTFKNHTAFADFSTVSPDQCVFTDAFVQPVETLSSPGRVPGTFVFAAISQFDICTGTPLVDLVDVDPTTGMPTFTGTVQFGTMLTSASINGSAQMFDAVSGALIYTASIQISWLGFGPTSSFLDSFHFRTAGFMFNTHDQGTNRQAVASGTFPDPANNNLASVPTVQADLENDSGGSVALSRP
jgi:hypothetical protein